jgi:phosphoglycolate phosphatase
MYRSRDRLVIFDADGTLIDAFHVVGHAFAANGMDIGDLERFQRRRKLLKYVGGLREFPKNLRRQIGKDKRKRLKETLTELYRAEAKLFPGVGALVRRLIETPDVRVGIVSRNVTIEPEASVAAVLERHGIDPGQLDFLRCIPLGESKASTFDALREHFGINPLRAIVCGDEYKDYASARSAGMGSLIVSYGFENHARLIDDYDIPPGIVARTPEEMIRRLCHALDLPEA